MTAVAAITKRHQTNPDIKKVEERLAVLHDAWRRREEAEIRALFADRADLAIWGTDLFERIVGKDEADREFGKWIASCPPWVAIESKHRILHVHENVAWAADEIEGRWQSGSVTGVNGYRFTTVWEKIDGEWSLVHGHTASPER